MLPSARDLQDRLVVAGDEHINQVVALLDRMEVRGAADALLDPLRGRLAQLAPVRPLTLSRLLFQPLDPVIEPSLGWRPGAAAVPRNALAPIGAAILGRIGPCAAAVRKMIQGRDWSDGAAVAAAGSVLWPAASEVLGTLAVPSGWTAAGLPLTRFEAVRVDIAAVLHHAELLHHWPAELDRPELPSLVAGTLASTQARHPGGLAVVLAVLLANAGVAACVLAAAATLQGLAPEAAVEHALSRTEQDLAMSMPSSALPAACTQAMRAATLLDAVDGPGAQPRFRALAQQTRRKADEACRGRVLQAVDQQLLPTLAAADTLDDAATASLEAATRDIRRLSMVGQRLGSAPVYAMLLNRTATGILAATAPALSRMDRLRLAELLVGADSALRMAPG